MTHWEVRSPDHSAVVQGNNWLAAIGAAGPSLGLEDLTLSRMVCDIQPDGLVRISDPRTGLMLLVRHIGDLPPAAEPPAAEPPAAEPPTPEAAQDDTVEAPLFVVPTELQALPAEPAEVAPEPSPEEDFEIEPPTEIDGVLATDTVAEAPIEAPAQGFTEDDLSFFSESTVIDEDEPAPADLAETLFDRCFDISLAEDRYAAARIALDILHQIVAAESGAVLYAGINHTSLEFLSAFGPHADQVREMTVPFGRGIAGVCFDMGASLIVHDATSDPRHLAEVDQQTGYRTGPMLSAVITDDSNIIYGVIELMNPPDRFQDWHLDAALTVTKALGDYLHSRG